MTEVNDVINLEEIQQLIPHRYPFLLVDKVINYKKMESCTGIKNVTINENKGFLPLRTAKNAHPQMIPIAKQIGKIIHDEFGKFIDVKEEYYE